LPQSKDDHVEGLDELADDVLGIGLHVLVEQLEITARTERLPLPRQDDDADVIVVVADFQGPRQLASEAEIDGVEILRPIEPNRGHPVLSLEEDVVERHRCAPPFRFLKKVYSVCFVCSVIARSEATKQPRRSTGAALRSPQ